MKSRYLLTLLAMAALSLAAAGQVPTPVPQQPTVADYSLTKGVKEVTIRRTATGGNDLESLQTLSFDKEGRLKKIRKRGFGADDTVAYPIDDGSFEMTDTAVRATYLFAKNPKTGQNYMRQRTVREADGDIAAVYHYNQDGRMTYSVHYVYAASGLLAASVQYEYSSDGGVAGRKLSSYSKSGKVVATQSFSPDEQLLMEESYTYDKQDNVVKRVQKFYDNPATKPRETVETRRYIYDSHGNWTDQRYSLAGRELYHYSRTINYY